MVIPPTAFKNYNVGAQVVDEPYGNTDRGLFSDWFNNTNIAREDWIRNEQALNNQLKRDIALQDHANEFSERMSNTQFQRAVADMRQAGLNPVLALGNANAPMSVSSRGSSGSSRSGTTDTGDFVNALIDVAQVIAGIVTKNPTKSFGFGKKIK